MGVLDEMLELDKKKTFGEEKKEEVKIDEKKEEVKNEVNAEEVKSESKTEEKKEEKVENTPWFKELEFNDEAEAKEFINKARNFKPEEVKPKFADTSVEAYNNWISNGGAPDFGLFQSVSKFSVSENPTPGEMVKAIVLKKITEEPDYKGEEAILEKQLRKKYTLNLLDEDKEFASDDEKDELKLKLIDLKKEFKETAEYFKGLQVKTQPVVDETLQTRLKEGPDRLKAHLDEHIKDLKINIPSIEKDEKGVDKFGDPIFSITFDEQMQKEYRSYYESFAKGKGYPDLNDGSHQEMQATAAALVLGKKLPQWANELYKTGFVAGEQKSIEKEAKEKNPSALKSHETKSTTVNSDDKSGEMFNR